MVGIRQGEGPTGPWWPMNYTNPFWKKGVDAPLGLDRALSLRIPLFSEQ